jgi:membrane-bound ClpP family serine protease
MSIGFGIFLFALGAILAFAVNVSLDWIELSTIGYILMIAGVITVIIGVILLSRRRSVSTSHTTVDPITGDRVTRRDDLA